jgi:hypothetical protein
MVGLVRDRDEQTPAAALSEARALRLRMNPHSLFNALNALGSMPPDHLKRLVRRTKQQMRQLSQRTERSLLLLFSSLYCGGMLNSPGNSKERFCNRRSFKLEMKIDRFFNNRKGVSSHCLPGENDFH